MYQLLFDDRTGTTLPTVLRLSDGAYVPDDPRNADRVEYERWLGAGNTPETADTPEPEPRLVTKSVIINRLTDAQIIAALALMTPKQQERWRAPDKPAVYADDPEMLVILQAIGADPAVILAG